MDEASKQLVAEIRSPIPVQPSEPKKYDAQYERNGVSSIFMFCEPLTGKCFVKVSETRTAVDWAHQIKELANVRYPNAERMTLVMDNLNLHTGAYFIKPLNRLKHGGLLRNWTFITPPNRAVG